MTFVDQGGCVYPLAVFPYEFSKYCQSSKRNMGRGSEIFPPKLSLRKCNRHRFRHKMFGLCVSFRYFLWLEVGGIVCTDVYVHTKRPLKNSSNFSKRILVLYWLGDCGGLLIAYLSCNQVAIGYSNRGYTEYRINVVSLSSLLERCISSFNRSHIGDPDVISGLLLVLLI